MEAARLVIYCLVPEVIKDEVLGDLRAHYARDDRVHVIVDRRRGERRASARGGLPARSAEEEREDRRTGRDRRRPVLPRWFDQLPPKLAKRAEGVQFVQRMLPVSGSLSGASVHEIVAAIRAENPEAPTELYWRVYERIHSRLCVLLGDNDTADRAAPAAFGRILDAIEEDRMAERDFDELFYSSLDAAFSVGHPDASDEPDEDRTLAVTDPTLDEMVQIKERDPRWFHRGMTERDRVLRLGAKHVIAAEHIGSTSVPSIAARAVIDLLVGVKKMQEPAGLRKVLQEIGYERCGDAGTKGRAYYRKRGVLDYDLHVVAYDSELWREALDIREFLRRNPSEAARWAAVKREAARAGGHSLMKYTELRRQPFGEVAARASLSSQRAA